MDRFLGKPEKLLVYRAALDISMTYTFSISRPMTGEELVYRTEMDVQMTFTHLLESTSSSSITGLVKLNMIARFSTNFTHQLR